MNLVIVPLHLLQVPISKMNEQYLQQYISMWQTWKYLGACVGTYVPKYFLSLILEGFFSVSEGTLGSVIR